MERGSTWLRKAQLRDGSWPAHSGQGEGCWTTALACLALRVQEEVSEAVVRGIAWLCHAWPGEGSLWWRFRHRLLGGPTVVRQNLSLRGWSWTPGTSSWVEPTCYALIGLHNLPDAIRPRRAAARRRLGEAMLYDRMCPGGGWNCGNPLIYGVAGEPQVGPTAWALLALQEYRDRTENRKSLDWLARTYEQIQGPGSLALAHICLENYGRPTPPVEPALQHLYLANQFFHSVPVVSWATLALGGVPEWLQWTGQGGSKS